MEVRVVLFTNLLCLMMRYLPGFACSVFLLAALSACTRPSQEDQVAAQCGAAALRPVLAKDWFNTLEPKDAAGFETYKRLGTFPIGRTTGFRLDADNRYTIHSFGPADEPVTIVGTWQLVADCPPLAIQTTAGETTQRLQLRPLNDSTLLVKYE